MSISVSRPPAPSANAPLWLGAGGLAILVGVASAEAPLLLVAAVAAVAASAVFLLAFTQPRWFLAAALFLVAGYVVDVARQEAGVPVTMVTLLGIVFVAIAARQVTRAEALTIPGRDLALLGGLIAAMVITSIFAADPGRSIDRIVDYGKDVVLVAAMLLLLDTPAWVRRAVWAVVLAVGGLAAIAVVQQATKAYGSQFGGFAQIEPGSDGLTRSAGPLSSNYFGQLLVFTAILALYLVFLERGRGLRLLGLAVFVTALAGVMFTFSRGSLVAIVVALALTAALRRFRPWVALGGAGLLVLAVLLFLPAAAKERIDALTSVSQGAAAASDRSLRGRVSENVAAAKMFADHPLVGVGPANYPVHYPEYAQEIGLDQRTEERQPHNVLLEALSETGIIGAAVLVAILWRALSGAWRARQQLPPAWKLLAEGVFVATTAFLVNGLFLHASAYSRNIWIAVGLALVVGLLPARSAARAARAA